MKRLLPYLFAFLVGVVSGYLIASKHKTIGYHPVKNNVYQAAIFRP